VEKEIARVNRIRITKLKGSEREPKFCLRYLTELESKEGLLLIQRAFSEENLRALASVFQQAVKYMDRS
jgi:hypothetical protein